MNKDEELIETLKYVSSYFGISKSKFTFAEIIELHENPIDIFITGLNSIGLKTYKTKISSITKDMIPFVFFEDDHFVIVKDVANDLVSVVYSNNLDVELKLDIADINQKMNNEVILIKDSVHIPAKFYKETFTSNPNKWFINVIKDNLSIYTQILLTAFFINIFVLATPLFTMNVYDRVVPNNAVDTLLVLVVGIITIYLFDFILKSLRSWLIGFVGKKADAHIGSMLYEKLLKLKLSAKPKYSGVFMNNFLGFQSLREFFTSSTIALLVDLPFIFVFIVVIYYLGNFNLFLVPVVTFSIGLIIAFISLRLQKKYIRESVENDQLKSGLLLETITGLEVIKCTGLYARMKKMWDKVILELSYIDKKNHFLTSITNYSLAFLNSVSSVFIVIFGVLGVRDGEMTLGSIIAIAMLNSRVNAPISQIVNLLTRYERAKISFNILTKFMQMPVDNSDNNYVSLSALKGNIRLDDVSFKYENSQHDVLKNISLNISKGEKIAILGKNGSGKSTLLKLISNLYEPSNGVISHENINISHIEPTVLKANIGYMSQENFLFMGTLKDNILSGTHFIDDDRLLEVVNLTGVNNIIAKYEKGLSMEIGERGDGFSEGEKQAISLSRTIINDPNILLLDEPTSQMDYISELSIIKNFKNYCKYKTVVLVTHKMALLELVDRIIIIDKGMILKDGLKDEVIRDLQEGKI